MRMRDRPTIEAETFIEAPPAHVWELVTDIVRMGQWSPEYQGGEWLDGATGPAVGSRFIQGSQQAQGQGVGERLDRH